MEAIHETNRFLVKAKAALRGLDGERVYVNGPTRGKQFIAPGAATAACKRASMDLTRALARLRSYR